MDIGIVHPELIYPRGAERQVCEIVNHMTKMGNEITIYTFETMNDYFFEEMIKDAEIISLDKKWFKAYPFGVDYPRWLYMIQKLSKMIGNHDILNFHNAPAQWCSKFTDLPSVWTCNEPLIYQGINSNLMKLKVEPFIFMDKLLTDVDLILALDKKMERIIQKRYGDPVEVLGSGVTLLREINHIPNDYIDIVFVGPIHPQKRPLDILKAFSEINTKNIDSKKVKIHFVGDVLDHNLHAQMVKLAKKNDLNIVFHGTLSNEELYNIYDLTDLAIFVPEAQPWGIFPLETMLGNIPTIVSDECGINEFINNDEFIIETGNIKELSEKIQDIINNMDYYKENTKKIAKLISREYSWETHAHKMNHVFEKVLNKK